MNDMIIDEIFNEYYQKKGTTEISIDQMKSRLGSLLHNIVLYGAGSAGIAFLYLLRELEIYPKYFADANPDRWGSICEGLEIIDWRMIVPILGNDALVIVTINTDGVNYCWGFDEMLLKGGHNGTFGKLYSVGCKNVVDIAYFRRCRKMFCGEKYNLPTCNDVYCMEQNIDKIREVYEMLEDEKSRDVYESVLKFRLIDDSIPIPTEPWIKEYYEYGLFPRKEDEIYIDCGAYNGNILDRFMKENDYKFKKYYGIEPDDMNYDRLERHIQELPDEIRRKVNIYHNAVYSDKRKLLLYGLGGPGSFVSDIGTQTTTSVKIDDIVDSNGASFITMNIEGAEIPALNGASKTIKEFIPRMSIAGYHKTWDLWEIPLLIKKLNGKYRISLRSYMNNVSLYYYSYV